MTPPCRRRLVQGPGRAASSTRSGIGRDSTHCPTGTCRTT
jgi:hypothetical protein